MMCSATQTRHVCASPSCRSFLFAVKYNLPRVISVKVLVPVPIAELPAFGNYLLGLIV